MEQNKTSKYFKYAIGEILLVVIGILIAVQINTWNQNRNRLQLEGVLLEQLKDELTGIYEDIISDSNFLKVGQESNYRIEDFIDNDLPYDTSLCFDFYWITIDEYIYPKAAVYDKIKEEGLDIIRNDTIRNLTRSVYESLFPRISKSNSFNPDISEFFKEYYQTHFKPNKDYSLSFKHTTVSDTLSSTIYPSETMIYPRTFTSKGIQRQRTIGYIPLNFEALKKDAKFSMLLTQTASFRNYKIGRYQMTIEFLKELVRRIDIELKRKND